MSASLELELDLGEPPAPRAAFGGQSDSSIARNPDTGELDHFDLRRIRVDAIVAPHDETVGPDDRRALRDQLLTAIPFIVADVAPGHELRIERHLLRRSRRDPEQLAASDGPFAWRPVLARRSIGLPAVAVCVRTGRPPAIAVAGVLHQALADLRNGTSRPPRWAGWYAMLSTRARAVVEAEATAWATHLWATLDWSRFVPLPTIGGRDDWWECPAPRRVVLHGRAEVRAVTEPSAGGHRAPVLVTVNQGFPAEDWAEELAFLALTATLSSPAQPVPARVVGLWPESGQCRSLPVDVATLATSAEEIVDTASRWAAAQRLS